MKISVIMYDGGYRERFHIIDCLNNQTIDKDMYEILWVEHFDKVKPELERKENVKIIKLNRKPPLFISYCWNEGIKRGTGDLLVLIDGDVYIDNYFLETVLEDHVKNEELVMYFYRLEEPKPLVPPRKLKPIDPGYLKKVCRLTNPVNYGGCLTVRKKWLLEVNGYEQFECFAGDVYAGGKELYTRFKNLGLHVKWNPKVMLYHPWHPVSYGPYGHSLEKGSFNFKSQHEVIRRRELSLETLPYKGIDPKYDREPEWWDDWVRKHRTSDGEKEERKKNLIAKTRGLFSKILGRA